jgi:hypothetical protein
MGLRVTGRQNCVQRKRHSNHADALFVKKDLALPPDNSAMRKISARSSPINILKIYLVFLIIPHNDVRA